MPLIVKSQIGQTKQIKLSQCFVLVVRKIVTEIRNFTNKLKLKMHVDVQLVFN